MAVRTVLQWGPLVALAIILGLGAATVFIIQTGFRTTSLAERVYFGVWAALVSIVLHAFFRAVHTGPGFVPKDWVRLSSTPLPPPSVIGTCLTA